MPAGGSTVAKRASAGPTSDDGKASGEVPKRKAGVGTWMTVAAAATHLGTSPGSLRNMLERRAVARAGGVEADIDGVRARKLGRHWRVWMSPAWLPDGID